ncbi:solute carrier family 49 member 4-like [Watersipora subatra]|uniref:solute carrier family 49 member 4-like n=1 Tax=Watersipora subatra TaxID=2589382 RepID=UPI00355C0E10
MDEDEEENSINTQSFTDTGYCEEARDPHANTFAHLVVYKRRWWILFVFCFCGFTQGLLWDTFSPLLDSMLIAYNWTDAFVASLVACSDGGFVIMAFPLMYLVETRDLRMGMILASSLLVLGMASWNIALLTNQHWLFAIGSLCNGITSCISTAAAPLLSATWFPATERITATAFSAASVSLGSGLAFITGPYIAGNEVTADEVKNKNDFRPEFVADLRSGVQKVVYFDTAVAVMSIAMITIYFPPKPPRPPSKSQTVEREDFWQGLKHLVTNSQFWILNVAYNVPNGTINSWLPLVSASFLSLGVGEVTAGWIGFASLLSSCFGAVLVSVIADCFKRKMKLFLILFNFISMVLTGILMCIQLRLIEVPSNLLIPILYLLCITLAFVINGAVPLYYEFGCEIAYPVHEGLSCSFISVFSNLIGMIFFLLFQFPELADDTQWMLCTCFGTCVLSLPLILILKENFHRLDLEYSSDTHQDGINDGVTSSSTISDSCTRESCSSGSVARNSNDGILSATVTYS